MTRWIVLVSCLASSTLAVADDPLYTCKPAPANAQLAVTFKPESELRDLITWAMGFQCRNVVVAADVVRNAPKITVVAPKKLTPKQALDLFVDAVESIGLVATVKADTIVIKPGPTGWRGCSDAQSQHHPLPNPYESTTDDEKLWATIKKIDETHYEVPRAVGDKVAADPNLLAGARMVPSVKDGKPWGIKIYAIRPNGLLYRLGFANGDTLLSVNGLPIDANKLDGLKKLKAEKRFELQLVRRGQSITHVVTVK